MYSSIGVGFRPFGNIFFRLRYIFTADRYKLLSMNRVNSLHLISTLPLLPLLYTVLYCTFSIITKDNIEI